jgi:hypothetical protein
MAPHLQESDWVVVSPPVGCVRLTSRTAQRSIQAVAGKRRCCDPTHDVLEATIELFNAGRKLPVKSEHVSTFSAKSCRASIRASGWRARCSPDQRPPQTAEPWQSGACDLDIPLTEPRPINLMKTFEDLEAMSFRRRLRLFQVRL